MLAIGLVMVIVGTLGYCMSWAADEGAKDAERRLEAHRRHY